MKGIGKFAAFNVAVFIISTVVFGYFAVTTTAAMGTIQYLYVAGTVVSIDLAILWGVFGEYMYAKQNHHEELMAAIKKQTKVITNYFQGTEPEHIAAADEYYSR